MTTMPSHFLSCIDEARLSQAGFILSGVLPPPCSNVIDREMAPVRPPKDTANS